MTMPDLQGRLERAARRHETPCSDGHMVWREWGAGRTVLLLHGSFGAWTHWLRNIEALSTHFRVLACDLPGMGESALPPMPFDAGSLADILTAGLEELAPDPFHMVGFSFGGIVGGHVAVRTLPRVLSYTAIGSNALGLPMAARAPLRKPDRGMGEAEILELHRHNLGLQMFGDAARIDAVALAGPERQYAPGAHPVRQNPGRGQPRPAARRNGGGRPAPPGHLGRARRHGRRPAAHAARPVPGRAGPAAHSMSFRAPAIGPRSRRRTK